VRALALGLMLGGCGVEGPHDATAPVDTAAAPEPCAAAQEVRFEWTLDPVPEDISFADACVLGEPAAIDGGLALPLACEGGPRTLYVWGAPAPPVEALRAGRAARLLAIAATDADGGQGFVRLEAADGGLLVAAAAAGSLAPPDGARLWLPFDLAPVASACLSEETACGSRRRAGVELRRSGGAPQVVLDAGWAAVGDLGEAQLWVAAAARGDAACLGEAGAYYAVGLVAAR